MKAWNTILGSTVMYPYQIQQKSSWIQLNVHDAKHVVEDSHEGVSHEWCTPMSRGKVELINSGHVDGRIQEAVIESTVEKEPRRNKGQREHDVFWKDFVFTD